MSPHLLSLSLGHLLWPRHRVSATLHWPVSLEYLIPNLVIDILLVARLGSYISLRMDSSAPLLLHYDSLVLPSFI
jgi:hypothetical protein